MKNCLFSKRSFNLLSKQNIFFRFRYSKFSDSNGVDKFTSKLVDKMNFKEYYEVADKIKNESKKDDNEDILNNINNRYENNLTIIQKNKKSKTLGTIIGNSCRLADL